MVFLATFLLSFSSLKSGCHHPQKVFIDDMPLWAHGGEEICFVSEESQEVTSHIYLSTSLFEGSRGVWQKPWLQRIYCSERAHVVLVVPGMNSTGVASAASLSWGSWVSTQPTSTRRECSTGSNMEWRCPLCSHSHKEASQMSNVTLGEIFPLEERHLQDTRMDVEPEHVTTVT